MIIAAILVLLGIVLAVLLPALDGVSQLDFSQVLFYLNKFQEILREGASVVKSFFIVPELFDILLTTYVAVVVLYEGYKLVMWVLAKIPMASVHD